MIMAKKSLITSSEMRSVNDSVTNDTSTKSILYPPRNSQSSKLWLWITSILIIGVIIFGGVSYITWNWLKNVHVTLGASNTQPAITTFHVERAGTYAELSFTVLNAQYATTFPNDAIQTGHALVRVNLHVTNKSTDQVSLIYYDVARLLVPGRKPIAPTNVHLSTGPKPGASEVGWIDFPVTKSVQLSTLKLQLGSLLLSETPLIIPFSGPFDPNHFAGKTTVDNNNGVTVSPGFGFDYIRLIINGYNTPPVDNTLPHDFKAGAHGVVGRVVYKGPAGLTRLDFAFLVQVVQGQNTYSVNL